MIGPCERPGSRRGEQTPPAAGSPALVTVPVALAALPLLVATLPIWVLTGVLASPFLPGKWRGLRLLWFGIVWFACEWAALGALGWMWLRSGFGRQPGRAALAGRALPAARLGARPGLPDRTLDVPAAGGRLRRRPPVPPGPAAAGALPARRPGRLGAAGPRAGDARPTAAADRPQGRAAARPDRRRAAQPAAEPLHHPATGRRRPRHGSDRDAGRRGRPGRRGGDLPGGRQLLRAAPVPGDRAAARARARRRGGQGRADAQPHGAAAGRHARRDGRRPGRGRAAGRARGPGGPVLDRRPLARAADGRRGRGGVVARALGRAAPGRAGRRPGRLAVRLVGTAGRLGRRAAVRRDAESPRVSRCCR